MLKKISLLSGILLCSFFSAQEFTQYKNGLIYSEEAMAQLGKVVDSLNLKYKTCDLSKVFYSQMQTKGYMIHLDSGNVVQAKKDIDQNISFENFISRYPNAKVEKDILFVKSKEKDYREKDIINVREISFEDRYGYDLEENYSEEKYNKPAKNTWIYQYNKNESPSKESMFAFYFPENFRSIPLDLKYNKQIIYSDCLIDTSSTKFKNTLKEPTIDLPAN